MHQRKRATISGRFTPQQTVKAGNLRSLKNGFTLSALIVTILYPLFNPIATLPVPFTQAIGGTVSIELLLSILCAIMIVGEIFTNRTKLYCADALFTTGVFVWIAANIISGILHGLNYESIYYLFRIFAKAVFCYMVYVVLMNTGRIKDLLICLLIGCSFAGVVSFVYVLQTGDLTRIRSAGFMDNSEFVLIPSLDIYGGIARAGAGNLIPMYICIVLLLDENKVIYKRMLALLIPFFAILALLPLRREVLLEGLIAGLVLVPSLPRRYWLRVALGGAAILIVVSTVIVVSDSWQARLRETADQFRGGTDPRLVLLKSTPGEMMSEKFYGKGPASYFWAMAEHLRVANPNLKITGIAAHSSLSRAAIEAGILGLLGVVIIVVSLFRCIWKSRDVYGRLDRHLYVLAVLLSVKILTLINMGDGLSNNSSWYFFGIFFYLIAEKNRFRQPVGKQSRGQKEMSKSGAV